MPNSQADHWTYTIKEWLSGEFVELTEKLPDTIKTIYDVGANVGGFAEVMRRRYPDAEIYCFEPVFANYDALIANVPWAHNMPYGIYYGERTSKVHMRDGNVGAYFVEHIQAGEPIRVMDDEIMQLRTFEEFDIPAPDLIKLDIEGAEVNVLENSEMVQTTPWLIIEWHPSESAEAFFERCLPNHRIVHNLSDIQFLLCLKK